MKRKIGKNESLRKYRKKSEMIKNKMVFLLASSMLLIPIVSNNNSFATTKNTIEQIVKDIEQYGEPEFIWSENYAKCVVKVECITDSSKNIEGEAKVESEVLQTPSCTEKGKMAYNAQFISDQNGEIYLDTKEIDIDALGHTEVTVEEGIAATCDKPGKTPKIICLGCNKVIKESEIIVADHTESLVKGIKATCTKDGKKDGKKCSICNKVLEGMETIKAKGHAYKTSITKAQYKKSGKIEKKCSVDGKIIKSVIYAPASINIAKNSFVFNGKNITPAVVVKDIKGKIINKNNYTVSYKNNKNAGSATIIVKFKGNNYTGTMTKKFSICKASQKMTVTPTVKNISTKSLKNKNQVFKISVMKAIGSVDYRSSNKNIIISKNGNATIKKGTKVGTYLINITAKGNSNYKSIKKVIKVKITN